MGAYNGHPRSFYLPRELSKSFIQDHLLSGYTVGGSYSIGASIFLFLLLFENGSACPTSYRLLDEAIGGPAAPAVSYALAV